MAALAGRVAVVTGVSRGIGRAIAVGLARAGARVAGCARRTDAGSFLDDLGPEERGGSIFLACDVRVSEQVAGFRAQVETSCGPADILVNNAGIVARAATESLSEGEWDNVLASNLTSTFLVTRAFLPGMKACHGSRIINVASIAGRTGTAMLAAYCAAKHGVVGLTRSWAEELRASGIAVNAICPGSVATAMLAQGMPGAVPKMTADDIAVVALFLAQAAPAALTGACIDVFG
ncbi:MAG: SDR family oxidoreductase [Polyangia bacterium]|jgi:3-oxoacyl-[acyl-carrier protein] reductase